MTHEQHIGLGAEPPRGPEHDHRLPDATTIPRYSDVEDSCAPPMLEVTGLDRAEPEYLAVEPGWWENPDPRHGPIITDVGE